jgi:imidazolonepropionase-like amidohydrolase
VEALQSATIVAARLMRQEAHVGQLVPGAFADLMIVEGDPTKSLEMLAKPQDGIRVLLQGGRVVLDRRHDRLARVA